MHHSLICPVIIGRDAHLAMMERSLTREKMDLENMLLLSGEAGWGKSRLTAEFKIRAANQGWVHFQGNCFETERSLPYAPITELLRSTGLKQIPEELTTFISQECHPTITDKYQLYFMLANFFSELAAQKPILIIVEDLHWCDDSSLEFLLFLVRRLSSQPALFLGTFRSNEIQPELAHFLSQLERERRVGEIRLAPLSRAETNLMIQTIFNQHRPTRAEFMEVLYPLTEGNPFYVEETLKSMMMAGAIRVTQDGVWTEGDLHDLSIPRSVQDSVKQRSQQLSTEAQNLLTFAAVTGRHFNFVLLGKLTGYSELKLLDLIKELLAAQLIVEESADQFAFRHALTRETVYAALLIIERRRLHQAIAETLEVMPGDTSQHLSDLAYHFYQAQIWDKTLEYSRMAGDQAYALHAYATAIDHFDHAIEAGSYVAPTEAGRLIYQRGYIQMMLDHFHKAEKDLLEALKAARVQENHLLEWETMQALGLLWTDRDYDRAGQYFQQAQSLARELDDPPKIAASLNTVGNWYMNTGQPFEALRKHQAALAIVQSLEDISGIAQTLDYLAIVSLHCGQILEGRKYYHQVLPMWEKLNFPRGLFNAYSSLAFAADYDLELDDQPIGVAIGWGEKSINLSRQYGWGSSESLALISIGLAYRQKGACAHALAVIRQGLEIAEERELTKLTAAAHGALGEVYLDIMAYLDARQHLETALKVARQTHSAVRIFRAIVYLAEAYIHENEFDLAKTLLDSVLSADAPIEGILFRMLWGSRIELALEQNDGKSALRWLDGIIAATKNLVPVRTDAGEDLQSTDRTVVPRLWYLRGRALLILRRFPEAEQALQAGLMAATQQERTSQIWRFHSTLASIQIAQNQRDAAQASLDCARQRIEAIATELRDSDSGLADHFSAAALASLPALPSISMEQSLKRQFGGLTAREREIASLVAQGQSNREIADMLFLSDRTVERHIANIMKKLDFNSRTQIAAWIVEKGLAHTPPNILSVTKIPKEP